ncbi:glycosyl transferase family 28 [Mycolicibacterium rhodesiae JS60]|nr:glycosyl transferase family 28 [Mycolicibacterium rhodesiae JS60]
MKFVLTAYGSRGDVEPSVVLGRELVRRGHAVQMAVPPNLVGFVESAGVAAVAYGQDSRALLEAQRSYWTFFFRQPWKNSKELERLGREIGQHLSECFDDASATALASLADGADMVIAGLGFEQFAANVAEYYDIPFAALHYFPMRSNGQVFPFLPAPLSRRAVTGWERLSWNGPIKNAEDAQRRALGLPAATGPWPARISDRGSLEIQAYDETLFAGLAAEWAPWNDRRPPRRPFVGWLTLELPTESDEDVAAWVAGGSPPIFFGFGSIAVASGADTVAMISAACAQLGERALICGGATDFSDIAEAEHVKLVSTVNYATIFPRCRAVVHHGGAGTTAAGLRAGVPTLILWNFPDQPVSGLAVKRLKIGTTRRLSATTESSLVADLRRITAPEYRARAREFAAGTSRPADSARAAADRVEEFARLRQVPYDGGEPASAMKFVLSSYGTRGEIEPLVAVGRELLHRGHHVQMVVPADLVGFAQSAGLASVGYQLDSQALIDAYLKYCAYLFDSSGKKDRRKNREKARLAEESAQLAAQAAAETYATLLSLAEGADVLFTGQNYEQSAADVAELLGIPLATLHFTPIRVNGQVSTFASPAMGNMPPPLLRAAMAANDWLSWRVTRKSEDAQRRERGLPKTTGPWQSRIGKRGSLEIQAYDEVLYPGLAAEWTRCNDAGMPQRPFVGALAMESATDADGEVASWIAEGTPPIFFGFGSMPVESAADMVVMITGACSQLGERALIGAGSSDFSSIPDSGHVKVVGTVSYAAVFPECRAVVHHGSTGTTAAGLRAGAPTLILWRIHDQLVWGNQVTLLGVGAARNIAATTEQTLIADLRRILAPEYRIRAREIAARMTKPSESVPVTADLLEKFARARRVANSFGLS